MTTALPKDILEDFLLGIDQFNDRQYFECHETLEDVWTTYRLDDRELIQGIIQISVGYLHLNRGNPNGAIKLLTRGLARVEKFTPEHFDLDLAPFASEVRKDLSVLKDRPGAGLECFCFPIIQFISRSNNC